MLFRDRIDAGSGWVQFFRSLQIETMFSCLLCREVECPLDLKFRGP